MTTTKIVRSSCGGLNSCRSSCYQRLSRSHDEQQWVIITSLALLIIVFIIFFIEKLLPFPGQSKVHKELRSQAGFQIVSWQSQARPRSSSRGVGASFPSRFDACSGLCMSKLQRSGTIYYMTFAFTPGIRDSGEKKVCASWGTWASTFQCAADFKELLPIF